MGEGCIGRANPSDAGLSDVLDVLIFDADLDADRTLDADEDLDMEMAEAGEADIDEDDGGVDADRDQPIEADLDPDETRYPPCVEPGTGPVEPAEGESVYVDDERHVTLVADDRISEPAARFYLGVIADYADSMLEYYGVDSPMRDTLVAYFVSNTSPNNYCGGALVPGCSFGGDFVMLFQEDIYFTDLNATAEEGAVSYFMQARLPHEISHALLQPHIMPWWGIREGIAETTAYSFPFNLFDVDQEPSLFCTREIGTDTLIEDLECDDIPRHETELSFFSESYISGITEMGIELFVPHLSAMNIPYNTYYNPMHTGIFLYLEPVSAEQVHITIYTRPYDRVETDGGYYIYNWHDTPDPRNPTAWIYRTCCAEDGYFDSLPVRRGDSSEQYLFTSAVTPYHYFEEFDDWPFPAYPTNRCFMEFLRQAYGEEEDILTVLLPEMMDEIYEYQHTPVAGPADSYTTFPFFTRVSELIGLSTEDTEELFRGFAPIEDEHYRIGHICLPPRD